jgi:hypothetical protein
MDKVLGTVDGLDSSKPLTHFERFDPRQRLSFSLSIAVYGESLGN